MKQQRGTVVAVKLPRIVTVKVDTFVKHPIYHKRVKRSKKYLAFSATPLKIGDTVTIVLTRPLSKRLHWKVVETV